MLQDDGKIVVAGFANLNPLLARYDGGAWDGIEQCVIGWATQSRPARAVDDGNAASGDRYRPLFEQDAV